MGMSGKSELGWKSIPMGGVSWKSSEEYLTGDWRTFRPVIDKEKCTKCLICWIYCPDSSIRWDGKEVKINYDYCKGCGICAKECPVDAIEMIKE
jgi:pyruvate ferredoxin oxidoreductase delta subunit